MDRHLFTPLFFAKPYSLLQNYDHCCILCQCRLTTCGVGGKHLLWSLLKLFYYLDTLEDHTIYNVIWRPCSYFSHIRVGFCWSLLKSRAFESCSWTNVISFCRSSRNLQIMMCLMLLELQKKKGTSGGQAQHYTSVAVVLLFFPGTGTLPKMPAVRLRWGLPFLHKCGICMMSFVVVVKLPADWEHSQAEKQITD